MATVRTDKSFHRQLARQANPATRATAEIIGGRARARLEAHRDTGDASIKVEHGAIDSHVILDDEASLSIEFGRAGFTRKDGAYVGPAEGLHILSGAI
jgi:hypothetical protein